MIAVQENSQAGLNEVPLNQWAIQVNRSPPPVIISMSFVAYMASHHVSAWHWGTWFFLVVAIQAIRWFSYRRLPDMTHVPVEKAHQNRGVYQPV